MANTNCKSVIKSKKIIPYLLISPLVILYVFFIGGGLIGVFKESLGYIPSIGLEQVNFNSYKELFSQNGFYKDLGFSVYIAFTSAIISTLFGIIISYSFVLSNNKLIKTFSKKSLQVGLILPYLYVIFLVTLFFSRSGFFSRILFNLGLINKIETFPKLIYDRYGFGLIVAFVLKGTPFVSLFLINVMSRISNSYKNVAVSLGASKITILKKIFLPLCEETIVWTSSILLAYDLGSFEVPYLLSGIIRVPLSSKLYSLFINPNLSIIPKSMALNIILLFLSGFLIFMYSRMIRQIIRGKVL
ncbi:ABC transporter permease [Helicovermis profundi]|uniref:ABC transporter permease subunit n=1 Tax=Helicovermis profundi TaxID=3065157 RepID=A0AAU9EXJ0_9FIRM|nr:ABC transporter permease subunit [Clostridia bacterium S502]